MVMVEELKMLLRGQVSEEVINCGVLKRFLNVFQSIYSHSVWHLVASVLIYWDIRYTSLHPLSLLLYPSSVKGIYTYREFRVSINLTSTFLFCFFELYEKARVPERSSHTLHRRNIHTSSFKRHLSSRASLFEETPTYTKILCLTLWDSLLLPFFSLRDKTKPCCLLKTSDSSSSVQPLTYFLPN